MASYLLILGITLAACFGLQSLALRTSGGRTIKSESNFFSSVARIQTGIKDQPQIMLLGSSLTGRLPDRSAGFEGVANLGCDGSSAADVLRAIDDGRLPVAPILIVEGNTLYRGLLPEKSEIARAIGSPWFIVGGHLPNLSATARPSAFLYSWLFARRIGQSGTKLTPEIEAATVPEIPAGPIPELSTDELRFIEEITSVVRRLERRGAKVIIAVLPPGGATDSANVRIPTALAFNANLPFWNLATAIPPTSISFTDGVHMAPQSSAAVMTILLEKYRNQ